MENTVFGLLLAASLCAVGLSTAAFAQQDYVTAEGDGAITDTPAGLILIGSSV